MSTEPAEQTKNTIDNMLVDSAGLLAALFPEACRPSRRWLDRQKAAGRVPHIRIGGLVFYNPAKVRESLEAKTIKARARS